MELVPLLKDAAVMVKKGTVPAVTTFVAAVIA